MNKKLISYSDSMHNELQKIANQTHNGNLNALIVWMLDHSLKTLDADVINCLKGKQ